MGCLGIDISRYQKTTDWSPDGLSFVVVKAVDGVTPDIRYGSHVRKARAAGLRVFAYAFNRNYLDVAEQAKMFAAVSKDASLWFIDVEGADAFTTAQTREFIETFRSVTGKHIGLYHSESGFFDAGQNYDWVAHWGVDEPSRRWDFHQYRGSPLDLDKYIGTEDDLDAFVASVHGGRYLMSYAPKSIVDAAKVWVANGGVNLGIVGDTAHTKGYHLGKDRIYDGSGPGIGDSDYSVKLARDKAGLTNASSALDLGRLNGSLKGLQSYSNWLVAQCRKGAPGTKDVREVIFSPDGKVVKRWDNHAKVLYNGGTGTGQGDDSHLTHTHISFYRDSESRDKTVLFAPYFDTSTGDDMPTIKTYLPGYTVKLKGTSNVRADAKLTAAVIRTVPSGSTETWAVTGVVTGDKDVDGACTTTDWYTRWYNGKWEYTSGCNIIEGPTAPTGNLPPDATSCKPFSDAAKIEGYNEGKTAGYNEGVTAGYSDGYAKGKTDGIAAGTATGIATGVSNEQTRIKGVLGLK